VADDVGWKSMFHRDAYVWITCMLSMVHKTKNRSIFETVKNRSVNYFAIVTSLTSFSFYQKTDQFLKMSQTNSFHRFC
jgi:hypothetical protein